MQRKWLWRQRRVSGTERERKGCGGRCGSRNELQHPALDSGATARRQITGSRLSHAARPLGDRALPSHCRELAGRVYILNSFARSPWLRAYRTGIGIDVTNSRKDGSGIGMR